jgi:hypothetical protein
MKPISQQKAGNLEKSTYSVLPVHLAYQPLDTTNFLSYQISRQRGVFFSHKNQHHQPQPNEQVERFVHTDISQYQVF